MIGPELIKPRLWERGLTCLNSPPLVSQVCARLDEVAGVGERLEVGVREGGSVMLRMAHAADGGVMVTVDPYGGKPFHDGPGLYGDAEEDRALLGLAQASVEFRFRWVPWRLLSLDFFLHVVPLGYWYRREHHRYQWRGVFLDGDHRAETTFQEVIYAAQGLHPLGSIVVDNVNQDVADPVQLRAAGQLAGLAGYWEFDVGDGDVIAVLSRVPNVPGILGMEPMTRGV